MTTGEKIAALRKRAGLSQEALGERLGGISRQSVSKWESDQSVPTMDNLMELSRIFGVPVDTLLRPDSVLPDGDSKTEQDTEAEATQSPEDTADESSPHAPPPVPDKRVKLGFLAAAVMLGASLICNVVAIVWLSRLQRQVKGLPIGGDTVYVPMPNTSEPESSDIADMSIKYEPDTANPERLRLKIRAMPKELDAGESAGFSVSCGEELVTVDAVNEGGYYVGEADVSLSSAPVVVSLMLTKDGKTRILPVDTLHSLDEEYGLDISWAFEDGGGMGWKLGRGGYAAGGLIVSVRATGTGTGLVWPVSGKVILLIDDQDYDSILIPEIEDRVYEWTDPYVSHVESSYYPMLQWDDLPVGSSAEMGLRIEITDNLGRVHTC